MRYVEGAFRLFDPRTENDKAKIPRFLLEQPCPWAGKFFRELPPKLQDGLRETTLKLAMIQPDDTNEEARRIWGVFDILHKLPRDGKRPRLKGHDAIHAALLVDRLRDDFSPKWQEAFVSALDVFLLNLKGASRVHQSEPKYRYWSQSGTW